MKLATEPYNKIISGKKVIESRLFDEKRQKISIGDIIIFSENDKTDNKITTIVKGLLHYQTFKELFADHDPSLFGEDSSDLLLTKIKQFYSDEDEQKYGVIGIRLKLQKTKADSKNSWSVDIKDIEQNTFDLSVANPNGGEEVSLLKPKEIGKLDDESGEILNGIQKMI
ncbi:MAG: ASCH domain-containing protein [Patescibacteria group bacterium]